MVIDIGVHRCSPFCIRLSLRHKHGNRPKKEEAGENRGTIGQRKANIKILERWTAPMLLPQECGRSGNGSKCSHHRSGQNFTVLFACIRHYFPRRGGNLNCAGAHHGTLTPPRISRSCVQEYHCGLTGSWRGQLAKAALA